MSALEEIRNERLKKLELLKEKGIDPYRATTTRTHTIAEADGRFDELAASGEQVTLAGRVMVVRGQGAILFADLQDGTGKFQAVVKEDTLAADSFALFRDAV
ncbi:MAG TPA: OB-fold nucleic acid binding domain-containing protein, partial [Candidatus Paceibacterota bacterium]|nr:OB-fold nucleic acid binding domain-containing protein [Candidatus Paceibacterota bacterium]